MDGTKRCVDLIESDRKTACELPLPDGAHHANFYAKSGSTVLNKKGVYFTIGASNSTCARPTSTTGVHVCSPTAGGTFSSPVRVRASAGTAVTWFEVWIDGSKVFDNKALDVDFPVSLGVGSHKISFYVKQGSTVTAKESFTLT